MKRQVYQNMDTTVQHVQNIANSINLLASEEDKAEVVLVTQNWFMIIGTEKTAEIIAEAKALSYKDLVESS